MLRIVCLLGILTSAFVMFMPGSHFLPSPSNGKTKVLLHKEHESEWEEFKEREEWINRMHRAAPGFDWREADRLYRLKRYNERFKGKSKTRSNEPVLIADGILQGRWVEKGSRNNAGRTRMADYDTVDHKIYVISDGGNVWKGNLDGSQWENLNDRFQITDGSFIRLIRVGALKRIFVGRWGKSGFYSDDDGVTWNETSGFDDLTTYQHSIERFVIADDSIATVYALASAPRLSGTQNALWIYRSINQGANFERFLEIPQSTGVSRGSADIWMPRYRYSDPVVVVNNASYRLNAADSSWTTLGQLDVNASGYCMLAGQHEENGNVRLYCYLNKKIYRSTDGGQTWEFRLNLNKDPFFKTSFSASVTQNDVIYFGDVECYRSLDGGYDWTKISDWPEYYGSTYNRLHADIPSVNCLLDEDGNEFQLINTDGGIYYSESNLQVVDNLSLEGLNISQYYGQYTARYDTNMLFVGSQDQGYQVSTADNGGILEMEQVISGDYGHLVSSNDGGSLWMAYPGFAVFYPIASETSQSYSWDFNGANALWIPPLMPDPDDPNVCFVSMGAQIKRLVFNGAELVAEDWPGFFSGGVSAMAVSPLDHNRWYVLTESGRFFSSLDRGLTWTSIIISNGPGANYLYGATIWPSTVNKDVVFVGGSGYSNPPVFRSEDNGASFTSMSDGLPNTMVFRMAGCPGDEFLFAATELGPYVYVPSSSTWHYLGGDSAPDQSYWWVEYISEMKTARFSTYGRGVWDFKITSPLSVQPFKQENLLVYPNPAKEFIMIKGLNSGDEAQVKVYSMEGKVLVNQFIKPGEPLFFDNPLSKGLYLVSTERKGKPAQVQRLFIR